MQAGGEPDGLEARYDIALTLELSQSGSDGRLDAERRAEYEQLAARTVKERFETLCRVLQDVCRVDSLGVEDRSTAAIPICGSRSGPAGTALFRAAT